MDVELQPGREAVVRVAVATLWTSPDAVRPVDRPALTGDADIADWIAGMDPDQQVGDCVLSQLLLGERVLVSELRADGWARVVAVEQPAGEARPARLPGLAARRASSPRRGPSADGRRPRSWSTPSTHRPARHARTAPVVLPGVVLGTRLLGRPVRRVDGWRPVARARSTRAAVGARGGPGTALPAGRADRPRTCSPSAARLRDARLRLGWAVRRTASTAPAWCTWPGGGSA